MESSASFLADHDLPMAVVATGKPRNCSASAYHYKDIVIDGTFADSQAMTHLRNRSVDADGTAVSRAEARKSAHYAPPDEVSFDERRNKVIILAIESVGRIGKSGTEFVDQLPTSIVGGVR